MYNNLHTTEIGVDMNDNRSYTHNLFKQYTNLSLNRIPIDDLSAVLYNLRLSSQQYLCYSAQEVLKTRVTEVL